MNGPRDDSYVGIGVDKLLIIRIKTVKQRHRMKVRVTSVTGARLERGHRRERAQKSLTGGGKLRGQRGSSPVHSRGLVNLRPARP